MSASRLLVRRTSSRPKRRIRLLEKKLLEPVRSEIPTLLLSGRFDPITPAPNADRVAAGLSHAFRYTFASGTHGQALVLTGWYVFVASLRTGLFGW